MELDGASGLSSDSKTAHKPNLFTCRLHVSACESQIPLVLTRLLHRHQGLCLYSRRCRNHTSGWLTSPGCHWLSFVQERSLPQCSPNAPECCTPSRRSCYPACPTRKGSGSPARGHLTKSNSPDGSYRDTETPGASRHGQCKGDNSCACSQCGTWKPKFSHTFTASSISPACC